MESTAVLYFLRNGVKLHFYSLGTIFEENIWGVQRGEIPWLWVSNRCEKHPCWHTILLAKSSVLYLLRPLTLERGGLRHLLCNQIAVNRHFSAVVGQADFVRLMAKSGFAQKQNPPDRKRKQRYISAVVLLQRYTYSLPSIGVSNICFASCCNSADVFSSIGSIVPT